MKNFYKRGMLIIMFLLAIGFLVLLAMNQAKAATPSFILPIIFQEQITGKVTDLNGNPLLGVTVRIKSSNYGTTTNAQGQYAISAKNGDVLVFSFVGYRPQEISVHNSSQINVSLKEDIASLDEVLINAGYYTVTERERTGNISRVTAAEIENQPVLNPMAAIQGRMPGVEIAQATGVPGGGFSIRIRGTNSLRTNGNDPLYIIDGVPFPSENITTSQVIGANLVSSPLNSINPADIKSIEVLKDADATAIYGSRGANGVVLITTKSGSTGKTQVNINTYTGVGKVANYIELMETPGYLEMRREAYDNSGSEPTLTGAPDLLTWDQEKYTNWQKELLGGAARLSSVQASLSGGTELTTFRVGTGYRKESTVFPGSFSNQKFSGNINVNHTSENQKFKAQFSGLYTLDHNRLPKVDLTYTALNLPPNAPELYKSDGSLNWENSTWTNPLAQLREKYDSKVYNYITNANFEYEIIEGLTAGSSLGYTRMDAEQLQTTPQTVFDPNNPINRRSSYLNNSQLETWIVEPKLTYQQNFEDWDLEFLAGGTIQETQRFNRAFNATGFVNDRLLENLQAASNLNILNSSDIKYKYRALFGRFHVDYKNKYLLNLTGRRDGSSRFGPGREYANFGAIGAAWIFSSESFWEENLPWINFGKLRVSYGTTGSDQIGDYEYLDLYRDSFYPYQGMGGFVPVRIANPDFGWETNKKFEAGLELNLFDNNLYVSTSYYKNRSGNQLVGFPLPGTTGFTSIQYNFPATVENRGWEFQVNSTNIKTDNFEWSSSFNLSIPQNELTAYENFEASPYTLQYSLGESLSLERGYNFIGVNPETGLFEFRDIDGNGSVSSPADLIDITDFDPDFYGGLQNRFSFKNLSIDFLFQFIKREGPSYYNNFRMPGALGNQPLEVENRWRQPGDIANFQMASVGFGQPFFAHSNALGTAYNITDVSYIRLKNLSVSYQIPLVSEIRSRIYFQAQNLFTITNYKGLDPENSGLATLPPLRFYTVGMEINL